MKMFDSDVMSSIKNDGYDKNDLDVSLYDYAKAGNSSHFLTMESRLREIAKTTPRKGKSKFIFRSPPEAPVFRPTEKEFENPLHYINSIKPLAEKCGICKIIPPKGWKSPFVLDMDKLKFTPRIQRINELEARTRLKLHFIDQLTKSFANRGKTFQIPMIEKTPLDLYTLHRCVRDQGGIEIVNKESKWSDIAVKMGFNGKYAPSSLKVHYETLLLPFLLSQQEKKEQHNHSYFDEKSEIPIDGEDAADSGTSIQINKHLSQMDNSNTSKEKLAALRELNSLKFLGPGPKMAVFDGPVKTMKTRTRGKKILYEFDPLAKYMCKSCCNGDIEELLVTCMTCEDRYHPKCLFPPLIDKPVGGWRCPKCVAIAVCKPLEEFGFAQAEKEYTLKEFMEMAHRFKRKYFKTKPDLVPLHKVEEEFWRVVSSIEEAVTVEYGADLHVIDHGSGFPIKGKSFIGVDQELYNKYAESSWNLNNLPVLKASVLRHISADISGMKIPWMYAGMCFATFCWHNEDHWSYSINYLHLGEPKTWYGVSGSMAEEFEEAMKAAAPELFETQPDILHQLVTIMNPNDIMAAGVPVYRTDQHEGEFVITFPRAYHAGFNQGFNFAEACNFAPYDWLSIGRECISHYSSLHRPCVFSHDELVCKMALMADELDGNIAWATINDGKAMLDAERKRRQIITKEGVYRAIRIKFEDLPDDERQCGNCNTTCFLSAVSCSCDETRLVCLEHVSDLCGCPYSAYVMKYEYQIDEIANMLMVLESKTMKFNSWLTRVEDALSGNKPKISLCELTELLIEANDKEFPRNDVIAILHYQVSKCIEVSALARAILSVANDKKQSKRITIEELTRFAAEMNNLPCTLPETLPIKQLVNRAKHIQRISSKNLSMRNVKKSKIIVCINWMKSLNLEFDELPMLQQRLKELEWLQNSWEILSNTGKINLGILDALIKEADELPLVKVFNRRRNELKNLKDTYLASQVNQNILPVDQIDITDADPLSESNSASLVNLPNDGVSMQTVDELELATRWQQKAISVLKGEFVLPCSALEELLDLGRNFTFPVSGTRELEIHVKKVYHWKKLASATILKPRSSCTLLQALWPRKFVSRDNFFKKSDKSLLENLISDDERNFHRTHYKSACSSQIRSLFKLRLDNLAARANSESVEMGCVCGLDLPDEMRVCELCLSAYHRACFTKNQQAIVKFYIPGLMPKCICSFCVRTKRPSLSNLAALLEKAEKLKIQIPEFFVLKSFVTKIKKWQKQAINALCHPEVVAASKALTSVLSKNHSGQHALDSPELQIEINRQTLINLRQLMIIGDSFEVTTPESSQIWMIINSFRREFMQRTYQIAEDGTSLGNSETSLENKLNCVKKSPMKQKQRLRNAQILSKIKVKKEGMTPRIFNRIKKPAKRKNTVKKGFSRNNKIEVGLVEEHEPGEACASGEKCVFPGDESIDWVQCDGDCRRWFHMKCVDLTNVTETDVFVCQLCSVRTAQFFDTITGNQF